MQAHGTSPRPVPDPAATAEAGYDPAPAQRARPAYASFLDEIRARAERQAEAIRAQSEWVEARRRELWARMDRLREEIGPHALRAEEQGHGAFPGASAPFVPTSPAAGHDGSADALAPLVPGSPLPDQFAAMAQRLRERVHALIGIVAHPDPDATREDDPRPEPW